MLGRHYSLPYRYGANMLLLTSRLLMHALCGAACMHASQTRCTFGPAGLAVNREAKQVCECEQLM